MALTRDEARPREKVELRQLLLGYRDLDGFTLPHDLVLEAMRLFDQMPEASPENVLWATIRHAKGDPGTLRAKVTVRAKRNSPGEVDLRRIRQVIDGLVPAGLGRTLVVAQAMVDIAEAVGVVAKPDAYEARVTHAG